MSNLQIFSSSVSFSGVDTWLDMLLESPFKQI